MTRLMRIVLTTFLAACLLQSANVRAQDALWRPGKVVEMIVPTSVGGGTDETARIMQSILHGRDKLEMIVLNRGGAGGGIAYAYMNRFEGNGHYLSLSTLNLITNSLTGAHPLNQSDITPIAHLFSEYPVFVVNTDSPIKTGRQLIDRMKADPAAYTIAFSPGLGGALHMASAVALKAGGVDLNRVTFVVYQSAGEATTAVIGGHIGVGVMNPPVAIAQAQGGRVRMIAISAPTRLAGALATVPTWKEQGVNGVFASARGVIGPQGMTSAQIAYWERMLAQMTKTENWKRHLEQNLRADEFMGSESTRQYYAKQAEELKAVIQDLGLGKTQ
jgi:putative tricarboxylic transport membrane protein